MSVTDLRGTLGTASAADDLAASCALVTVTFDAGDPAEVAELGALDAGSLPVVLIGVCAQREGRPAPKVFDVAVDSSDPALERVIDAVTMWPIAATSLAVLLRAGEALDVELGLAAESAVYSLLQAGPEFAAWRAAAARSSPAADREPAVIGERIGATLHIVLNRPQRHNAFSRSMRDAISELLAVADVDDTITAVHLSGRGPSFCSGGDLGEFGSFTDPATAHRTRLGRSPARLLHRVRDRVHAHVHGACMGAGIELAAFAAHVTADPDVAIALPEISLGLIPGAGGTVSIPRRIGRQATALLALTGMRIGAGEALRLGLVDEISTAAPHGATL